MDNAITTGMLPKVPRERIQAIGNAAAAAIAREAEYLELSTDAQFPQAFMRSMFFSPPGPV